MEVTIISYQYREYPEFSWSVSREGLFRECKRKYFYQYYGSHNGWEDEADERTKKIYRLKKLENIYALVGRLIHDLAAELLETEQIKRVVVYQQKIRDTLNEQYRNSRHPQYRKLWEDNPASYDMLQEVYFNDELEQRTIDRVKFKIEQCIPHLIGSRTLTETPKAVEYTIIDDVFNNSFTFRGYKIFAVPDLIYQSEQGQPVIVDWKTGNQNPDKDIKQLQLYHYYYYRQHYEAKSVLCRLEYLVPGECQEVEIRKNKISGTEDRIETSIEQMRKYVVDGDLDKNRALPEKTFEKCEEKYLCQNCRFYSVCE